MTTELDSELVPEVLSIIDEVGATVTLEHSTTSTYDPTAGTVSGTTVTEYTKKITPPSPFNKRLLGDTVKAEDLETYVAASGLGFVPKAGNTKVVFDGVTYNTVAANPIYTGDEVAAYHLQLRR